MTAKRPFRFVPVCVDKERRHGSLPTYLKASHLSATRGCPFAPHRVVRELSPPSSGTLGGAAGVVELRDPPPSAPTSATFQEVGT